MSLACQQHEASTGMEQIWRWCRPLCMLHRVPDGKLPALSTIDWMCVACHSSGITLLRPRQLPARSQYLLYLH